MADARGDDGGKTRDLLLKSQAWQDVSSAVLQLFNGKPLPADVELLQESFRRVMDITSGEDIYSYLTVRRA